MSKLSQIPLDLLLKNVEDQDSRVFIHIDKDKMKSYIAKIAKAEEGVALSGTLSFDRNPDGTINSSVRNEIHDILLSLSDSQNKAWSIIEMNNEESILKSIPSIIKMLKDGTD